MTTWAQPKQLALMADPLDERFTEFHQANPHVYDRLVAMAREWRVAGHDFGSIAMFFEALRYEVGRTNSTDQFKLNNSLRSRYARLIAWNEPDLAHFFHTRALRTDWEDSL